MMFRIVFWDVLPCKMIVYRRFRGAYCLHHQGTPNFTITKNNWLTLFKEIIAVYSENREKPINTKCSITDCQSRWFI
jgi:hypothetical protein